MWYGKLIETLKNTYNWSDRRELNGDSWKIRFARTLLIIRSEDTPKAENAEQNTFTQDLIYAPNSVVAIVAGRQKTTAQVTRCSWMIIERNRIVKARYNTCTNLELYSDLVLVHLPACLTVLPVEWPTVVWRSTSRLSQSSPSSGRNTRRHWRGRSSVCRWTRCHIVAHCKRHSPDGRERRRTAASATTSLVSISHRRTCAHREATTAMPSAADADTAAATSAAAAADGAAEIRQLYGGYRARASFSYERDRERERERERQRGIARLCRHDHSAVNERYWSQL